MEKKNKGAFKPSGSEDVLSVALETPEHSGRVRGVGSFVTPSTYFNMPKEKKTRITKAEFEKTKNEFMSQIAELKAELRSVVAGTSIHHSPIFSDKSSCPDEKGEKEQIKQEKKKCKPKSAKLLVVNEDKEYDNDDCVAIGPVDPSSHGNKVKISVYIDVSQCCLFCGCLTILIN